MQQLGQISSQVLGIPFYKIRSLFEEAGEFVVRESLSPALVSGSQDSLDLLGGPFDVEEDYYRASILALCGHAEKLGLGHHVFLAPIPKPRCFRYPLITAQ